MALASLAFALARPSEAAEPKACKIEARCYVYLAPAGVAAPLGFRPAYQWGTGAGLWFGEARGTAGIGTYGGHVVGWQGAHLLRTGFEVHAGFTPLTGIIEPFINARIGYAVAITDAAVHGLNLAGALGLNFDPGRRGGLYAGTMAGADVDLFRRFYLFPIVSWRAHVGVRF